MMAFVENAYIPDLLAVAGFYKDWGAIGGNLNFMAYGDFPRSDKEPDSFFMPRGRIMNMDIKKVLDIDPAKIFEDVAHAWYEDGEPKNPAEGETNPLGKIEYDRSKKYSWLKAPRYEGEPVEVGPLARVLVAYAKGHKQITPVVDMVLKKLDVPAAALFSTLGRTAARGIETLVIGQEMGNWINDLVDNIKKGDTKTYTPWKMPDKARGMGLNDVARGALGHWIEIEDKKIKNYQQVVPSTWNLGPRCSGGKLGPVESALIGTPIADVKKPIEILRTVHSFDPCIACAVHVVDEKTSESCEIRVS
jgi:[NiFe] hydrogenase large subunit